MGQQTMSRRTMLKNATLMCTATMAGGAVVAQADEAVSSVIPESWDYEADIVVVGAGAAGATAAIEAYDNGTTSVLVLEKESSGGGCLKFCGGTVYGGGTTTRMQAANGYEDTPEGMMKILEITGGGIDDPELLDVMAHQSGPALDWLEDLGVVWNRVYKGGNEDANADVTPAVARCHTAEGGGYAIWAALESGMEERGIEVMYDIDVTKIIADPVTKEVFGVEATLDGKTVLVKAAKAVILAGGPFSAHNREYMGSYCASHINALSMLPPSANGEMLKLGQRLGADVKNISGPPNSLPGWKCRRYDWGEWGAEPLMAACIVSVGAPFIYVNKNGVRFFDEMRSAQIDGDMIRQQPDSVAYMIFDDAGLQNPDAVWAGNVAEALVQSPRYEEELADGTVKTAQTLEELAEIIGLDPAQLVATVERYNDNVADGEDSDFGKTKWLDPIQTAPFYAIEVKPVIPDVHCGLHINTLAQIFDVDGVVIPRLYGAGTCTGGWRGMAYPGDGGSLLGAFTFGRIAGQEMAKEQPWG